MDNVKFNGKRLKTFFFHGTTIDYDFNLGFHGMSTQATINVTAGEGLSTAMNDILAIIKSESVKIDVESPHISDCFYCVDALISVNRRLCMSKLPVDSFEIAITMEFVKHPTPRGRII